MTLARPSSYFIEDLSKEKNFSKQRYGSVPRVYIVCPEDLGIPLNYQHWMIQNAGFNDVVEINGADHKPMVCKPQELCDSLQQIAAKYQWTTWYINKVMIYILANMRRIWSCILVMLESCWIYIYISIWSFAIPQMVI